MEKDKAEEKVHNTSGDEDIIVIQMKKPGDVIKVHKTLENIFG